MTMDNSKHTYILINENIKTLGVYNDEMSLINNLNKYIIETVEILKSYNVDIKKFYENVGKWRISCFTNYEIGYYKFVNNNLTHSNNNIPIINYKLNIVDFTNNDFDYEINKIFIAESDGINCNIKLNNFDIKNLNNLQGTETLIKNCLLTENNIVIIPKEKSNTYILKEKLLKLNEEKKLKIEKKNQEIAIKERKKKMEIERTLKINKDNEEKYTRKYLVDRKLYFIFKNEVSLGVKTEEQIPLMYKKQWNIFKELESKNLLDASIIAIDEYSNELNNNNELSRMVQKEICKYKILDDKYKHLDIKYKTDSLFNSDTKTNGKFWRMMDDVNEDTTDDENTTDNEELSDDSDDSDDSEGSDNSEESDNNTSVEFTGPLLHKLNDNSVRINFSK